MFHLSTTFPLPKSFSDKEVGLLTLQEYLKMRDPDNKSHPDGAYDLTYERMNKDVTEQYIGRTFTSRSSDSEYSVYEIRKGYKLVDKRDDLGGVIYAQTLYYDSPHSDLKNFTDSVYYLHPSRGTQYIPIKAKKQVKYLNEALALASPVAEKNLHSYPHVIQRIMNHGEPLTIRAERVPEKDKGISLAILNSENYLVAQALNEWGATLLMVVEEYRGRGLGKIIGDYWYKFNPSFISGGFTSSGYKNAIALWEKRVREFLANGWYSALVKEGRLTNERVKDILKDLKSRPPGKLESPTSQKKGEILYYFDGVTFIIYNSLFLEDQDDKYIYGHGFYRSESSVGDYVYSIDYDRPYAKLTTQMALQGAKDRNFKLYNGEGYSDLLELEGIPGVVQDGDYVYTTQNYMDLNQLSKKEKLLRKRVDPYDEILNLLGEQAEAKWK